MTTDMDIASMYPLVHYPSLPGPHYTLMDSGQVDGDQWIVLRADTAECQQSIRAYHAHLWYEHGPGNLPAGSVFEVHERIYTLIAIAYSS